MEQNHKQLNEAIKDRKIDDIVRYLRLLEPRLKGISPLTEGPIPTVYVDLGQESLLPLSSAGSGISNFLHMVLPISLTDRGVVIIDEIEDGIHHSKLEELSRFIIRSSKDKDIQFFISTHSREFIDTFRAACRLEGFQDLSLLRCSQKNGENYVTRYDYSEFEAAEELQAEMR
jgi:AAA15 family ATPase/GTPase